MCACWLWRGCWRRWWRGLGHGRGLEQDDLGRFGLGPVSRHHLGRSDAAKLLALRLLNRNDVLAQLRAKPLVSEAVQLADDGVARQAIA